MVNHAIHWLDVMNWFFGKPSEVAVVNGRSREFLECADYASGLVRYAGGQLVVFSCGTYCNLSHPDHLTIDSPVGRCDYRGTGTRMAGRSLARKAARWLGLKRFDQPNPMQRQVQDFVDSVREGREPPTTVDQAYEALKLASALSMDSRTGGIRLTGGFKTPVIP
jgi:predicted dehydrogenase